MEGNLPEKGKELLLTVTIAYGVSNSVCSYRFTIKCLDVCVTRPLLRIYLVHHLSLILEKILTFPQFSSGKGEHSATVNIIALFVILYNFPVLKTIFLFQFFIQKIRLIQYG